MNLKCLLGWHDFITVHVVTIGGVEVPSNEVAQADEITMQICSRCEKERSLTKRVADRHQIEALGKSKPQRYTTFVPEYPEVKFRDVSEDPKPVYDVGNEHLSAEQFAGKLTDVEVVVAEVIPEEPRQIPVRIKPVIQ